MANRGKHISVACGLMTPGAIVTTLLIGLMALIGCKSKPKSLDDYVKALTSDKYEFVQSITVDGFKVNAFYKPLSAFIASSLGNMTLSDEKRFRESAEIAKKIYESILEEDNEDDLFEQIKTINEKILGRDDRSEAFFIILYFLVRKLKPVSIIETGVHRGVSSLFILQALEDNGIGKLYSIDLPLAGYETDVGGYTKSFLPPEKVGICVSKKLRNRWNLILGDSKDKLPKLLSSIKSIDLFLHDSKHTYEHMMWEFGTIWPILNNDGILVSDDTNWNKSFLDFATKMGGKNIQLARVKKSGGAFGVLMKTKRTSD